MIFLSVAEIAEKPLYRVTCGDLGTKATECREVYADRPLPWKNMELAVSFKSTCCLEKISELTFTVLLLDEADVFLEERQLVMLIWNATV